MWRCKKQRYLTQKPDCLYFKPIVDIRKKIKEVEIMPDEFEAVKIADVDEFDMKSWAKKMWISAPTFCRILSNARRKIWLAIINWFAIKICSSLIIV